MLGGVLSAEMGSTAEFRINQSRTMIRVLAYDGSGFWLMTKRLSQGKFRGWPKASSNIDSVDARHLRALLSGAEFAALQSVA